MKLPKLAINNNQFTLVVVIMLVLSGIISFFTMPYSEDPQVSESGTSVIVIYPGANPTDMEQLVVDPIEEAINELDDIDFIDSSMGDGIAVIAVRFVSGSDPDEKYSDATEKVNTIRDKLPDDIMSLELFKWSVSDVNILQVAIISDSASYRELEKQAKRLKKKLEKVGGVRKAETWAFPEQEVRVSVDLEKMSRMRISLNQIFGVIQSANINIPGGNIDIGTKRFNIQTSGSYKSLEDIGSTIIHSTGKQIIYLKDVADIQFDYEDEHYLARFNEKRAVFVTANQKEDTNIFNILDKIKPTISEFERQLPASMTLHYVFDQSKSVAARVKKFANNLIQGIILVGVVVLFSLSFRSSIIVMLAIPVSITIGIGFIDLSGYGIQQMTIAGLVIALGILVDNAIVVTENTTRFLNMGFNRKDAAIKGTEQIGWAIVSATATTVLAFVPIIMMRDITGDFIRSMPLTVVYTLTASLFIALTFTPYLSSRFLKVEHVTERKSRSPLNFLTRLPSNTQKFQDYFIHGPYRKALDFALSHSKLVIALSLILFLGSLALFPLVGVSFFPKAEKPQFIININTPKDTNLDKTNDVARYVESVLSSKEEIKHYATNVGHGNPRIYYNVGSSSRSSTHAQILVELKKFDRKIMSNLVNELRKEFADYPDAHIDVKELEQGPPIEAPIAIRIIGENLDVLRDISRDVETIISATPGTINTDNPLRTSRTDLHVKIKREKAGMLGVQLLDIDRTVRTCVAGMAVSRYRDSEGKEYDIVLRLPIDKKFSISDFDKIYVTSVMGVQVPLKQVASLKFKPSAQEITHRDLDRSVTITADVLGDYSVDKVTKGIISKLDGYNWKPGYYYDVGGEVESRGESFGGMGRAVIIAMIGIFAVLILQFRSFTQPLIVFAAIPLAIIGSILGLLITGYTFSFTAFVGLTSLVGIVVNNSIILVDYTNKLRQEDKDLISAVKEAGETRFRPIIFTTATTIGGLLPLTLQGGTLWAPMGWTIIGGLTASTVLTLIVVPVLYKIFSTKSI
ncbi:efflux RND transporter permease subunit [bacterium]|nr:efflux RND transporter permease subunit [bacterium]